MKEINGKRIKLSILIIIIISMLILVGIVLSLTLGENGLIKVGIKTARKTNEQANVTVTSEIKERLGNGIVNILIKVESDTEIENITFPNEDGTSLTVTTDKLTLAKDLKVEVGKEYPVTVKTKDGKETKEIILIPQEPKIKIKGGYPKIKTTGIVVDISVEIDFNKNELLENLYSEDNGQTWKIYTQAFSTTSNKIIAKSQHKRIKGISIESNAVTTAVVDAVPSVAFDGSEGVYNGLVSDNGTFAYWTESDGIKRMTIDSDSTPINLRVVYTRHRYEEITFKFYNGQKEQISSISLNEATWEVKKQTITIPKNSTYVEIKMSQHSQSGKIASTCIYEMTPVP